jgi:integrase
MLFPRPNSELTPAAGNATVPAEASPSLAREGDLERVARRRYQHPKPFREGNYWWIKLWTEVFVAGQPERKRKRVKLAPADTKEREVLKIVDEYLRPINQNLESIGSATNFTTYVNESYIPVVLPLMATSTQARYRGIINNYLLPAFGKLYLRDLGSLQLQKYFSAMSTSTLAHESRDKIRDTLSSILGSAVRYQLLVRNPVEGVQLPPNRKGKRVTKPNITWEQFDQILAEIPEPYATMVYVVVCSGLRVSELIGLRWNDVGEDCLMVDERCCRGDWSAPKSEASNAAVAVQRHVIERIYALKLKTVSVRAGTAVRHYKAVKSDGPNDLIFQSVKDGKPMRDNNILSRFIKPAARKLRLGFVNWRCLRTSYGTWLKRHGADMKDIQGQMRHSRISTTMDIYVQDIPESRRRSVEKLPVPTTTVQ